MNGSRKDRRERITFLIWKFDYFPSIFLRVRQFNHIAMALGRGWPGKDALEQGFGHPFVTTCLTAVPAVFGEIGEVAQAHDLGDMVVGKRCVECRMDKLAATGRAASHFFSGLPEVFQSPVQAGRAVLGVIHGSSHSMGRQDFRFVELF